MKKTAISLADGRELIYYDEDDETAPRDERDERQLPQTHTASELRYDPFLDAWVIVASHRQERVYLPPADLCPLCPTRPGRLTEIPAADYDVVVFENRFPSLAGVPVPGEWGADSSELFGRRPGYGRCEVVCYTSDHDASFARLSPRRARLVLAAWTDRTVELSARPGVEQVFCFENRGREIGVTLEHPHGQIYAYPFVTPRTSRVLASVTAYRRRTGRNLFDDVLAAERADGSRVVASTEDWTAFVPQAARWPFEVHLYPHRRVPDLVALNDAEREQLVVLYLDVLRRFDALFDGPAPYISGWHQAPVREGRQQFALHLELFSVRRAPDKLKYLAGSESGMDAFAMDIVPEAAAERLREVG
ncbi:MAG TPA: galactose-1-phosphate uridylyltransferase [Acidimicrobiales bacterium]|nr:galactose-1-phosphate uridylyltransferase [Acidimicrobiales bacterium]